MAMTNVNIIDFIHSIRGSVEINTAKEYLGDGSKHDGDSYLQYGIWGEVKDIYKKIIDGKKNIDSMMTSGDNVLTKTYVNGIGTTTTDTYGFKQYVEDAKNYATASSPWSLKASTVSAAELHGGSAKSWATNEPGVAVYDGKFAAKSHAIEAKSWAVGLKGDTAYKLACNTTLPDGSAKQYAEMSGKYASEADNVSTKNIDGGADGFSSRHYRSKSQEWAANAAGTKATDDTGAEVDYSAKAYAAETKAYTIGLSTDLGANGSVVGTKAARDLRLETEEWAIKTGAKTSSYVGGSVSEANDDYSAKEWAVGTTVPEGSAKSWATQVTASVADAYISKRRAIAAGYTSESFADEDEDVEVKVYTLRSDDTITSQKGIDKTADNWVITVVGNTYSAKHHKNKATAIAVGDVTFETMADVKLNKAKSHNDMAFLNGTNANAAAWASGEEITSGDVRKDSNGSFFEATSGGTTSGDDTDLVGGSDTGVSWKRTKAFLWDNMSRTMVQETYVLPVSNSMSYAADATKSDTVATTVWTALDEIAWKSIAINADVTAIPKGKYMADTNANVLTVTLPASPIDGDAVVVWDNKGTFETNNATIARNGKTIMGQEEDLVLDVNNARVTIEYIAGDWRVA